MNRLWISSAIVLSSALYAPASLAAKAPSAESIFNQGMQQFDANNYSKAIAVFEQGVKLYPSDAVLWHELAIAYDMAGFSQKALNAFTQATRLGSQPSSYHSIGVIQERLKNYDAAADAYRETIEHGNERFWQRVSLSDNFLYLAGQGYAKAEQYKQAKELFLKDIERFPDGCRSYEQLAFIARASGETAAVQLGYLEAATNRGSQDADVWRMYGVALLDTNQIGLSLGAFERALALDSENAVNHYEYGLALLVMGRFKDCEAQARQVLALGNREADAYFLLGSAIARQGRWAEADGYLTTAMHLAGPKGYIVVQTGDMALEAKQYTEAIDVYRQAIREYGESTECFYGIARAYDALAQKPKALDAVNKAADLLDSTETSASLEQDVRQLQRRLATEAAGTEQTAL